MNYENENKQDGETEVLSFDEQNVARLLSSLKRVDAPKDFDFHLKARIANASPEEYKPVNFFPVLRYVLPLVLFLAAGGAIMTRSYIGSDVPAVASVPQAASPIVVPDTIREQQTQETASPIKVPEEVLAAGDQGPSRLEFASTQTKRPAPRSKKPAVNSLYPEGGSYDSTGKDAPPAILAPVLGGNSNSMSNTVQSVPKVPLQVRQMFISLGIDAIDGGGKTWAIRALAKDGIAERSGLQVGDMMEAIDDKPINTLYVDSFSVRSISVRRGGSVVKVDIQLNKP